MTSGHCDIFLCSGILLLLVFHVIVNLFTTFQVYLQVTFQVRTVTVGQWFLFKFTVHGFFPSELFIWN